MFFMGWRDNDAGPEMGDPVLLNLARKISPSLTRNSQGITSRWWNPLF
ncbi:hypothetical protein CIHG_05714 [Coccidioides immitis H538.4]|uniref:Uncharacterized protein n=1 Tax=Coccidioides immitis H538.4 TaxID=396776 RepID=A0A0J8RT36_COCIT|nr:hypothetical protein CIHG_05714 [Coccidioides immitis H538.4]